MRIAIVFVVLFLGGCAGAPPEPATPAASGSEASKAVVPPGQAKVGDKSKCPVSGEEFVVSETSPKLDHNGKTYYFCCAHCKDKAAKDPDKFLTASE